MNTFLAKFNNKNYIYNKENSKKFTIKIFWKLSLNK